MKVSVQFMDRYSNTTHYKYNISPEMHVKSGDWVVVPVRDDNNFALAYVTCVHVDADFDLNCRWVVDVVDMAAYKRRLEREQKRQELKIKLDVKLKNWQKQHALNMLLATDDEAQKIAAQLNELSSS